MIHPRVLLAGASFQDVEALGEFLRRFSEMEIVGSIVGFYNSTSMVRALQPDVLIVNSNKYDGALNTWLRAVKAYARTEVFLALSSGSDTKFLRNPHDQGVDVFQGEVLTANYIPVDSLTTSHREPRLNSKMHCSQMSGSSNPVLPELSKRELSMLQLLAEGYGRREIAYLEGSCLRTVERTASQLYRKFGASTQFQLGVAAAKLGLVGSNDSINTRHRLTRDVGNPT